MKQVLLVAGLVGALMVNGNAAWAEDASLWQKMLDTAQQAYDAGKYSKAARSWMKVAEMLRQSAENAKDQIMLAGCLKHLGDCHRLRERWQEAGESYQESLSTYGKLAPDAPEVASGVADLSSCYKTIVVDSLGEQAAKLLRRAGAVCLSSFKKGDGDHFELALADTYTHVVNEDKIEQVRFNKRICFDFAQTPEGKLNVSKIRGVDVKADVCWVEPRSTTMYLDDKGETTAEVTVDALGFMKTVTINPPRQIYDYILEMVKQVNSGPVVASGSAMSPATPVTSSEATAATTAVPVTTPDAPTTVVAEPVESTVENTSTTSDDDKIDSQKETESVSK